MNTSATITNPWHALSAGENAPEILRAVIEIPQGSKAKYELDKETGMLFLDRVLRGPYRYPIGYGFVPQTLCDDKDPLDVVVFSSVPLEPFSTMDVRVVGVIGMIDGGEGDDKIVTVANDDPAFENVQNLEDLPEERVEEIRKFFEDYKKPEGKTVEITGVHGREKALEIVRDSIQLYSEKHQ